MKLLLFGRAGSRSCEWSSYALLRDNVQHFIEHGEPSEHFAALHGIEEAVDGGHYEVEAARLRGEVLRAWDALWSVPLEDAAVSLRTRAMLTNSVGPPTLRGTVRARQAGWGLPVYARDDTPVPIVAKRFVMAVIALTETAVEGEALVIRRDGTPPRCVARRGYSGRRNEHAARPGVPRASPARDSGR